MPDTWPVGLPQCFTFDSLATGFADNRLRSQTDTGPAKVRPRSTAGPRPLSGQMVMTLAQIATLETFVETTLLGGSLPFTFPSQIGGAAILVRFAGELPAWSRHGMGRMMVSMSLEILP